MQGFVFNNARHTAFEAQHRDCCLIRFLIVAYMVEKPSTVDEAIAYVWDVSDTVIGPADKQSLAAALAEKQMLSLGGTSLPQTQRFGWAP